MEISKKIETVRNGLKELIEIFETNAESLDTNDFKTQDILHQMELGSYNEGRKWYGALRQTRKDRRVNKDTIEILAKTNDLLTGDLGTKFLRQLDECLGDARNQEKKLSNRHYTAKYIHDLPISKDVVD